MTGVTTEGVDLRRQTVLAALIPLFFVSGATGLVYQTIWSRELHLVFGTSTFAIATVLSAFMGGLALGAAWISRRVDAHPRPLALYGQLEIGIGVFAVLFPHLVTAVQPAYLLAAGLGPLPFGLVQGALVGVLLLVPTAMMGATLPLLARFAGATTDAAGEAIGWLYALNTAGAVVGTAAAGFFLLPQLGLATTTWGAAAANVMLGVAAIGLARRAGELPPVSRPTSRAVSAVARAAGWATAIAGFSAMVYEVAWFRVLALMLGGSVYAFSTMLLAFLVGIAGGGALGGRLSDRLHARGGSDLVLLALAVAQVGIAASSVLSMHLYPQLPFWYVQLFDGLGALDRGDLVWAVSLVLAMAVMTPPAFLMGVAFPLTVRAAVDEADESGGVVGRLYAWNTAGGVLGAALAGFVLLPLLTVRGAVVLAAVCNVAAALAAWRGVTVRAPRVRATLAGLVVATSGLTAVFPPSWDPLLMTAGMPVYVSMFDDHSRDGLMDFAVSPHQLMYYREGLSSVVTVGKHVDTDNLWLANNGKVDASTRFDLVTQILVGVLPFQYAPDAKDALVIGLASGITAGAVAQVDSLARIDVAELEPAIVDATRLFAPWNHDVLDDPRVELVLNDGRNQLLRAAPASYDVIVSEPSNPWLTGVSNLFTDEYFALGKTRLREGGVWSQWLQLYAMDHVDVRSLLMTFADHYAYVLVYGAAEDADLVLLGSDRPLTPSLDAAQVLFRWSGVREDLSRVEIDEAADVIARWTMGRAEIVAMAGDAPRNTDDNMRIEYRAPLNLHEDTQADNIPMLLKHTKVPYGALPSADDVEALAYAYDRLDQTDRAVNAMIAAGLRTGADDARRDVRFDTAFEWFRGTWFDGKDDPTEKEERYVRDQFERRWVTDVQAELD